MLDFRKTYHPNGVYFIWIFIITLLIFSCSKEEPGNHLINESSPYLLQHAFNPVDWYPWGEEALQKAQEEDKLLVISVGYASCHWCHVMEEESFEDSLVSEIMNANFVSIKVDKEERPDIDGIYMDACALIRNRSCGWPLNVIALPDGRAVFAGTYFEKEQWIQVLETYSIKMEEEREELESFATDLKREIVRMDYIPNFSVESPIQDSVLTTYVEELLTSMDTLYGGRQGGIKFPNPNTLDFLLAYGHLFEDSSALDAVQLSLDNMAYGGIYDQLGGGFSRYSTDPYWKVPHFEKMLYDNAQLIGTYSKAYRAFDNEDYKRIVEETIEFCDRELASELGPYYSSLDADINGEEGTYYVWSEEEINTLLQEDKVLNIFKSYYQVGAAGVWEYDKNVLFPQRSIYDFAQEYGLDTAECALALNEARTVILNSREQREKPALDDKILASWNGLMIQGLCEAYKSFGDPTYLSKANAIGQFILDKMKKEDGSLYRNYKGEQASINAFLDDYANVAKGFLDLYAVSFDEEWIHEADSLLTYVNDKFKDEDNSIYFYTSTADNPLMTRKKEILDGVMPASNSTLARVIADLGVVLDQKPYKAQSLEMLQTITNRPNFKRNIGFNTNWGLLYLEKLEKVYEVVVMGPDYMENKGVLELDYSPNIHFMGANQASELPLLQGKYVPDANYIYVCKSSMCKFPVETVEEAQALLDKEFNQDKKN